MNAAVLSPVSPVASAPSRAIALRTRGRRHGPITRLVSPSDIGELIKPFVFLDLFDVDSAAAPRFGWHPHSGIATLTLLLNGGMSYQETTGVQGVLAPGGIEWMRAGDGVWHTGSPVGEGHMKGFQLWVALPPGVENAPAESRYLSARELAAHGPARVILGSHGPVSSPLPAPPGMNYLDVNLRAHERWTYAPPPGHTVLWLAVHAGRLRIRGIDEPRDSMEEIASGELVVFDESTASIEVEADGDTSFILGSAVKHPHDLVLGQYSVHTNPAALARGEEKIRQIGAEFFSSGKQRQL